MDGVLRPSTVAPGASEAFLPSPCIQNHAANLACLPDGTLACVWFGGSMEGASDISIYMSRLEPGAECWSPAEMMSEDAGRSEQNPILFNAPGGEVWLLFTAQRFGNQDTAIVRRRVSTDNGRTFGPIETFVETPGTFVRQPPVVTASGNILLPIFRCIAPPGGKWGGDLDTSAVLVSSDNGGSWTTVEVPESTGCVHMNIVPAGGDTYLAVYRSRFADHVYASRSADDGLTWSRPEPTDLPNNNSSIQMIALDEGGYAIVYNHSAATDDMERRLNLYDEIEEDGEPEEYAGQSAGVEAPSAPARTAIWGTPRAPMSLAFSGDGLTFHDRLDLETGDGYCLTNNSRDGLNREFSYPSIVETSDGALHVAYTYHRRAIRYRRLPRQTRG
nr:exo-alpha-sialidase [Hartmannibacter diazotrophicus]